MRVLSQLAVLGIGFLAVSVSAEVILKDDFSVNAVQEGTPAGWKIYKSGPNAGRIAVEDRDGKKVVILDDSYDDSELGLTRTFPAEGGKYYRIGLKAKFPDEERQDPVAFQLRFQPENKPNQAVLEPLDPQATAYSLVTAQAPEGTQTAVVYIYGLKTGKPIAALEEFILEVSDGPFADFGPWKDENAVLIKSSFADVTADQPLPRGWRKYAQGPSPGRLEAVKIGDAYALRLIDDDDASEIGISRPFGLVPGAYYRATVKAKAPDVAAGSWSGFLLQISGHPSKIQAQTRILGSDDFVTYTAVLQMPEDAEKGVVYIYSHKPPRGSIIVKDFRLERSSAPFAD